VDRQASQKEIREAYLELANQYHPDKVLHWGKNSNNWLKIVSKKFKSPMRR
jgi:DnaJ-class molecular chaperone